MFKKQHLALAIAATLAAGAAQAALETSVTLKNETAYMTSDSIRTGEGTTWNDTTGEGKGVYKFENTAKIYLNDELESGGSWHGELNIVRDTKAINDYQGHETNTQRDWLRELYVDTTVGDWDVRLGKQQVVWGTADGIKLLDMINPTDWSEFNQNAPADARIPVWMVNGEKYLDDGSNVQLVLSQSQAHKIAGLNASGDQGHPFIMKGVDSITGKVNGFLNVAPALGTVATVFDRVAVAFTLPSLVGQTTTTVNDFATGQLSGAATFGTICNDGVSGDNVSSADCLAHTAHEATLQDANFGAGANNQNAQNLLDAQDAESNYNTDNPNSMFEYMYEATFATFDSFVGMTATYKKDHSERPNIGGRYRWTTNDGTNFSVNALIGNDANPYIDMHWEDDLGRALTEKVGTDNGTQVTLVLDRDGDTTADVGGNTNAGTAGATRTANLVMTEKLQLVKNLGFSFDKSLDTANLGPVVLRGEFLYQQDVRNPVITRKASNGIDLNHGFLVSSVKMEKGDMFKYVIGADTTVATDMMVSGQFIQFRNLDHVDIGNKDATNWKYTADMATLNINNNMKKAEKNKEFYSLFLSKPFGESGEGRWNNIFIYEEGGGKWNRFDVEYGFDDQLIGTFEVNKYFGDNNTMFGQFENASNVQIGVKYLLH